MTPKHREVRNLLYLIIVTVIIATMNFYKIMACATCYCGLDVCFQALVSDIFLTAQS